MARDEARGEDPDVGCWDLKQAGWDGVNAGVEFVDERADHGADSGADELAIELRFGRGAQEMACLEILEEIAGLKGARFGNGACKEIDNDRIGMIFRCGEREEELREFGDA